MDHKLLVWNCKGVVNLQVKRVLKEFIRQHQLAILVIMEPRVAMNMRIRLSKGLALIIPIESKLMDFLGESGFFGLTLSV